MAYGWCTPGVRIVYGLCTHGVRILYGWRTYGVRLAMVQGRRLVDLFRHHSQWPIAHSRWQMSNRVGGDGGLRLARGGRGALGPGTTAEAVPQQVEEEQGVIAHVTRGEAAGFGGEPIYPRQTQALHPRRGVGFHPGVYIEGEADGQYHSTPQPGLVALYPGLLLGRAKADPDEVGGQAVDLLDDRLVGGTLHPAVGQALAMESAYEAEAGVELAEDGAELGPAGCRAAEQVMGGFGGRSDQELTHEGWAIDAVAEARPGQAQAPDQRHAVRREAIIGAGQVTEPGLMAAHGNDLGIGEVQGDAGAGASPLAA